jgi:arginase family enzyme
MQEGREGAGGGPRGTRHAHSNTMSSSLKGLAGFNSNIRSSDANDKTVKTMDTIQESLSKLCMNSENKIHKFIFLKTISQH